MNNNRGNNRRRGRGNNNRQQGGGGGGGQQLNRIDSRARGNAPQLLEKYRKLAHDAHLNGDRVTEEYYLQFADHYFRVIADTRQRQEETRQQRSDRWQENGDGERYDADSAGEYGSDGEYGASPYNYGEQRREREFTPRREQREEAPAAQDQQAQAAGSEEERAGGASGGYEPAENPFTRDARQRTPKPRRARRDSPVQADEAAPADVAPAAAAPVAKPARKEPRSKAPETLSLDLAVLPPAIAASRDTAAEASPEAAPEAAEAKPKRRVTRRKPPAGEADETLQAAS